MTEWPLILVTITCMHLHKILNLIVLTSAYLQAYNDPVHYSLGILLYMYGEFGLIFQLSIWVFFIIWIAIKKGNLCLQWNMFVYSCIVSESCYLFNYHFFSPRDAISDKILSCYFYLSIVVCSICLWELFFLTTTYMDIL